jgi:outer membrane biogenesis lipoprotein LolB
MNKLVLFSLFGLVVVALLPAGCQKDNAQPPTKTELLSKSPWIFLSASASGTDVTNNQALACFKDNIITFAANGNFIVSEGAVICTPSTAGNFTWTFQTNETQLVLSAPLFSGGSGTFTLVLINETNLVVSQNVTIPPSTTAIPVIFTFRH